MSHLFTKLKISLLCAFVLVIAAMNTSIAGDYSYYGGVFEITRTHINIGDRKLRISPTVKVSINGNSNASINDLTIGENVEFKVIKFNGKIYVDTIIFPPIHF